LTFGSFSSTFVAANQTRTTMKKLALLTALLIPVFTFSQIINIPDDYPAIQQGIDAANHGDTVLVAEGVYYENLNFKGKAITLASYFLIDGSRAHIDSTVIDGSRNPNPDSAYVIYFVNNEDSTSVLAGFTLKYGTGRLTESGGRIGGGIFSQNAFPKMLHNKIISQKFTSELGQRPKSFKTWISLRDPPGKMKGCLYRVNDSSLALIPGALIKQDHYSDKEFTLIKANQMEMVKIRRKNSIGKGVLIGALSGLGAGIILGLIEGDDEPGGDFDIMNYSAGEKAILYGITFMIPGAAIGAAVGSIKIKIPINGSMSTYEKNRKKLKRYSVK